MRLQRFKIKNFRSIKDTELSLLDTDITTFIGANGSGKSNLLKALVTLAGENIETPTDEEFHAQESEGAEDAIEIEAEFSFEDKDRAILAATELTAYDLNGFIARVTKPRGETPFAEYIALGASDKFDAANKARLRALMEGFGELAAEPIHPLSKQELIASIGNILSLPTNLAFESLTELRATLRPSDSDPERGKQFLAKLDRILAATHFDLTSELTEVFSKLSVELLLLNSYVIENRAPVQELSDRGKHPFLFDLLVLSDKKATEFSRIGLPFLSRIKDAASKQLSQAISGVWPSHKLEFQIDRHADDLVFMVFTPQGHQVSLTDLSDGEQWFLKFYVRLAIAKKDGHQVLWLFDEPGRDLHTSSQIDLKGFFEEISQETQIIYTSHLAMMMPWHRLERIFAVENSKKGGTIIHSRFWKDADLESPLKLALSTFVGEELIGGRQHVIVEGISDLFYIQAWARFFQKKKPAPEWVKNYGFLNRILIPVDGIEKMPLYCWFLGRKVKKNINWVVIADSADEAEATVKKMANSGLGAWTNNVKSVGELISPKKATALEIEAAFKLSDYLIMVHDFYSKAYPGCELPSEAETVAKLETQPKLSKALSEIITEKNPTRKMSNGKPIALDKTGVAQYIYKVLANTEADIFSKETETKFAKILENIDRTFANEYEDA